MKTVGSLRIEVSVGFVFGEGLFVLFFYGGKIEGGVFGIFW